MVRKTHPTANPGGPGVPPGQVNIAPPPPAAKRCSRRLHTALAQARRLCHQYRAAGGRREKKAAGIARPLELEDYCKQLSWEKSQLDTPELDRLLKRKLDDFNEFRQNQKELWQVVDGGYLVCDGFIRYTVQLPNLTKIETHRAMMWWTMLDYQMESFFLNINRQLDLALASLRMASELSRDIARIDNDEGKLNIWLNRDSNPEIKKQYRKNFRFDDSDSLEKYVHDLYDIASSLGIHGHFLRSGKMRPVESGIDKKYIFSLLSGRNYLK